MCFAPQRRALFRHLKCQNWSAPPVFCAFWLRNVLRATTACNFSTTQVPKVVRTPGVLCILTSKCASRHNSVQFFDISSAKSGPDLAALLCFSSVHIVGSLTSKLPSIMYSNILWVWLLLIMMRFLSHFSFHMIHMSLYLSICIYIYIIVHPH